MSLEPMNARIAEALRRADETREVHIAHDAIERVPELFRRCFGDRAAIVVADTRTLDAAGCRVMAALERHGVGLIEPFIFDDPALQAYHSHVLTLLAKLERAGAIPVAVGSGTINDIAKLAAHYAARPYMAVATAASMDGYTAYGASITREGWKQTINCPAPRAVVADLDVICAAPPEMNAAGYADLAAKIPAGADWIIADALGIEPIEPVAWSLVQDNLRSWLADPDGVRRGDEIAIRNLLEGLLMTGLAMQASRSSRPASGAEHQFSHLWDMQHHTHDGAIPFHGYKVAIGTLASAALYERLLSHPIDALNADEVCARWPSLQHVRDQVERTHADPRIREIALGESCAKYIDRDALKARLGRLKDAWPRLKAKLHGQLIPSSELATMFQAAGAPTSSSTIGIEPRRLRESFAQARQIRRRYTVLDLAVETSILETWPHSMGED